MADEKEKTINKIGEPVMIEPRSNHPPEIPRISPDESIALALSYLREQQKGLQFQQQQANSELKNAYEQFKNLQVHLDASIQRLDEIQRKLEKKSAVIEKLISGGMTPEEKQRLANTIISVHDNDL